MHVPLIVPVAKASVVLHSDRRRSMNLLFVTLSRCWLGNIPRKDAGTP